jgi:hypothetical protein
VQADDTGVAPGTVKRSPLRRWLLALPLLIGLAFQLVAVALPYVVADASRDPRNAAIFLVPGLLYGLAAALLVGDRPQRLVWTVLLFCGAVLTAAHLAYLVQYREPGELMLYPPYLTAVAMFELERRRRRRPSGASVQL